MAGKKFRFRLESVLQLRRSATEKAQRKLADTIHLRRQQEQRVDRAERALRAHGTALIGQQQISVSHLQRSESARQASFAFLEKARAQLTICLEQEREARFALQERQAEEEALNTLREQALRRHQAGLAEAEEKELGEQALNAFRRKERHI